MISVSPATREQRKKFLAALEGEALSGPPPCWFMRQAGRYLPEYRALRAEKNGFLNLVMDPVAAAEVTLQPLRRFGMDAAILFSDILVVPLAMGQNLTFAEGEGPRLDALRTPESVEKLDYAGFQSRLDPIYETVSRVRRGLMAEGHEAALIGFAGSPWTVAAYMIEGRGSTDFAQARKMMAEDPGLFSQLIEKVSDATVDYLSRQVEAGAEALQLFDSWAGLLDAAQFQKWVIGPTEKIVKLIHVKHPHVRIIGFPRGAGAHYGTYAKNTGIDGLGLDQGVPLEAAKNLQKILPVQGNLDPAHVLAGGKILEENALKILEALSAGPFIFNLGHGIDKNTPPKHVAALVKIIRDFRA